MLDFPAAFGATPAVRAENASLAALWDAYNVPHAPRFRHPSVATAYDSNQTKLFRGPFFAPTAGTFEGYLLDRWFAGNNTYDALFVEELPPVKVCGFWICRILGQWVL